VTDELIKNCIIIIMAISIRCNRCNFLVLWPK